MSVPKNLNAAIQQVVRYLVNMKLSSNSTNTEIATFTNNSDENPDNTLWILRRKRTQEGLSKTLWSWSGIRFFLFKMKFVAEIDKWKKHILTSIMFLYRIEVHTILTKVRLFNDVHY